jgi:hypothetical protein
MDRVSYPKITNKPKYLTNSTICSSQILIHLFIIIYDSCFDVTINIEHRKHSFNAANYEKKTFWFPVTCGL